MKKSTGGISEKLTRTQINAKASHLEYFSFCDKRLGPSGALFGRAGNIGINKDGVPCGDMAYFSFCNDSLICFVHVAVN